MKNEEIETLEKMIERAELEHSANLIKYKERLFIQWRKIFENDKKLQRDAENAQNASEYGEDENGIYSWFRVKTDLKEYSDCSEFFETWLSENYNLTVDWENDCFVLWQGDDNIIIQVDTGRDNGVWQGSKLLFDEDLYRTEDGTVDIEKRNALIEEHMEKTGYFPGVFRVDQYGNVSYIQTLKKN